MYTIINKTGISDSNCFHWLTPTFQDGIGIIRLETRHRLFVVPLYLAIFPLTQLLRIRIM